MLYLTLVDQSVFSRGTECIHNIEGIFDQHTQHRLSSQPLTIEYGEVENLVPAQSGRLETSAVSVWQAKPRGFCRVTRLHAHDGQISCQLNMAGAVASTVPSPARIEAGRQNSLLLPQTFISTSKTKCCPPWGDPLPQLFCLSNVLIDLPTDMSLS